MTNTKAGILGASTWMARELLEWLGKWRLPDCAIILMDRREEVGRTFPFLDQFLPIQTMSEETIASCDILFNCLDEWSEEIGGMVDAHTYVIHLQSCVKQAKVLLPNVNLSTFHKEDHEILIPCASFSLLTSVISIIQKHSDVTQAVMTSLHSVAELGDEACKDLMNQIQTYAKGEEIESAVFPLRDAYQHLPLLFQALPQTSCLCAEGSTCEELFIQERIKECLHQVPSLCATCVRVAGLRGLSMSIALTCTQDRELDTLIDAFSADPSFICIDDIAHNMYPICADVVHDYRIYIGRMRKSDAHTFAAWAVCDDLALRCGGAVKAALYILHNFEQYKA